MADFDLVTTALASTPTNLATLLARLRVELHDEDAGDYRWTDATLERHIERAVRDLSLVAPRERLDELAADGTSRELSLSTLDDLVLVHAVEYPIGEFPPVYVQFGVYAGVLSLLVDEVPEAAAAVNVYWGSLHTLTDEVSTLKAAYEDIVVLGAGGYAALEWASFASNRANLAGTEAFDQYSSWGADALQRFRDQLLTLREGSRIRVAATYAAARPEPSRHVVTWQP